MNFRKYRSEKNDKLQKLTEKFLEEFFIIASEEDKKRNDSYHFNYTLVDILANTKFANEEFGHVLLDSGFAQNVSKEFFHNNIQGFSKHITNLIEKFEKQDTYTNYRAENLSIKDSSHMVEEFTGCVTKDFKIVEVKRKIQNITFDVNCSSSGFSGKVVILKEIGKTFIDDNNFIEELKYKNMEFYNISNKKVLTITFDFYGNESGEIQHFKYCADINSFFNTINNIEFNK